MKVSDHPHKIVIVHRVVLSECCVILFGLRFDMVAFGGFWWLFLWKCCGFVRDRLASLGNI